ncbi:uncharacterized protein PHACADRAFT_187254 [Phanerochaete carnosa HHB-10118-sp]|uniref:Phosphoglycerate mutase-like protein n=1 Tax=Phanerochaete carnosa (strain HHB-10118-sp) TaxID=650164 RepID=K5UPY2_PHACS|nr:uncharacterized protein PHACADRAFT_187254 [Phanerochaete carnosa HHB-10118-sp]EKM51861.1 hypothetical protein PHACADRAFT_187254 [Phanerochaete carnosa HHB-10118-sp]
MAESGTVAITFIRHGESEDNLRPIWAGWRDTPLSELGTKQVKALGSSLSSTRFDIILSSTLRRAYMTAKAVQEAQHEPKPEILTSLLLREQTRGIAEGHPWITEPRLGLSLEEHYAQGLFPIHHERWQKFPGGESLEDLELRANKAVKEVILPHALTLSKVRKPKTHIAVASHGLLIAEMIPALLKLDPTSSEPHTTYRGMLNSAWARVTVEIVGGHDRDERWPDMRVRVTDFNSHAHLNSIVPLSTGSEKRDSVQTFAGDEEDSIAIQAEQKVN